MLDVIDYTKAKQTQGIALFLDLKAGVNIKAVFWLCITFLTQISRSRFKQSTISLLIPHIYVLGCFKFFGDFLMYLEINSFSERISKIYGNRKF